MLKVSAYLPSLRLSHGVTKWLKTLAHHFRPEDAALVEIYLLPGARVDSDALKWFQSRGVRFVTDRQVPHQHPKREEWLANPLRDVDYYDTREEAAATLTGDVALTYGTVKGLVGLTEDRPTILVSHVNDWVPEVPEGMRLYPAAVSASAARPFEQGFKTPPGGVPVIPNAVWLEPPSIGTSEWRDISPVDSCLHNLRETGVTRIGYLGRLTGAKGAFDLLDAVTRLIDKGHGIRLVHVGEIDEDVRTYIRGMKHKDQVELICPTSALGGFWDAIDIYVSASRQESFGLSTAEAIARHIPTVALTRDGAGKYATLCPAGATVPELASMISVLIGDREYGHYAEHIAENAQQLLADYDPQDAANRWLDFFWTLVPAFTRGPEPQHRVAVVSAFFNPTRSRRTVQNMQAFFDGLRAHNVHRSVIELTFDYADQQLPFSTPIQGTEDHLLWQKERLINLAVRDLPDDVDTVVWSDGDLLFVRPNWAEAVSDSLDTYRVVQCFDTAMQSDHEHHLSLLAEQSFGEGAVLGIESRRLRGDMYHQGLAWAVRRDFFDQCGLLDRVITGSNDSYMLGGFYGEPNPITERIANPAVDKFVETWSAKAKQYTQDRCGYVHGTVIHLEHGTSQGRRYIKRDLDARDLGFDPVRDLVTDDNGLLMWSRHASPELRRYIAGYFQARDEDQVGTTAETSA